jgi:hypothetical protein
LPSRFVESSYSNERRMVRTALPGQNGASFGVPEHAGLGGDGVLGSLSKTRSSMSAPTRSPGTVGRVVPPGAAFTFGLPRNSVAFARRTPALPEAFWSVAG